MSLWAISAAPLLARVEITTLSDVTDATLTNPGVIAVDHDSLGLQGVRVESYGDALSTREDLTVLLLNRTGHGGAMLAVVRGRAL